MIRLICRAFSTQKTVFDPNYKFKCGLEIHCQLKTKRKLFSNTPVEQNSPPNTRVSLFDYGIPGTQPILNNEAVVLALIAGVAFNCNINTNSSFDRKHYFYADQPMGYQITQYYNPICKNGYLELFNDVDDIDQTQKRITLDQVQLEQDTGKIIYSDVGLSNKFPGSKTMKVDFNRANMPLIEVVTNPDFEDLKQVKAFIKKFQGIVKHLNISTGELETGAMRVDVNVSVNGGNRVEIKNLSSSSAVLDAIKYEYKRQISEIEKGNKISQETRGWDGEITFKARDKETATDYRYMPDPELPRVRLSSTIGKEVEETLISELPDTLVRSFMQEPYSLKLKEAKLLVMGPYSGLLQYFKDVQKITIGAGVSPRSTTNYILHELIGQITKKELTFEAVPAASKLAELILAVHKDKIITNSTGKLLLGHLIENRADSNLEKCTIRDLAKEFDLLSIDDSDAEVHEQIEELCQSIISEYPDIVSNIKNGKKPKSIKYLVGQAMRATQGKVKAGVFEETFKKLIG